VAQIPQVVNLTKGWSRAPGFNWNDFWVGERDVATVKGTVIGVPALVDTWPWSNKQDAVPPRPI